MSDTLIRLIEATVLELQRIDGPPACPVAEEAERAANALMLLLDVSVGAGDDPECVPMLWP